MNGKTVTQELIGWKRVLINAKEHNELKKIKISRTAVDRVLMGILRDSFSGGDLAD